MGERWRDLAYALEGWSRQMNRGTGKLVDRPKEKWKPDIRVIKEVIQFVKATERFQPRATIVERVEEAEIIEEESREVSSSL
jgi:hypothetical protein